MDNQIPEISETSNKIQQFQSICPRIFGYPLVHKNKCNVNSLSQKTFTIIEYDKFTWTQKLIAKLYEKVTNTCCIILYFHKVYT